MEREVGSRVYKNTSTFNYFLEEPPPIKKYLYFNPPSMTLIPVLYPFNPPLHPRRHLPRLLALAQPALHQLPPPTDASDRTHHRGGAGPKTFHQSALARRLGQFAHGESPLVHFPSLRHEALPRERQDAVSRDPFQNRAVQRCGPELFRAGFALDRGEEVHGARFGHVLLVAEQPEVLVEATLGGLELRHDTRCVVRSQLPVADAAGPGPHGVVGGFQRDRFEPAWVVRAHGACDDV